MNPAANKSVTKKKITFNQEWSLESAKLQIISCRGTSTASSTLVSNSFGSSTTRFRLNVFKNVSNFNLFDLNLYLESSRQKSVSIEGKFKLTGDSKNWPEPLPKSTVLTLGQSCRFAVLPTIYNYVIHCEITFEEEEEQTGLLEHESTFYAQFGTLRLDGSFSDITLLTTDDGRSFPAHKLILATRSPVFAAMFRNGEFTESQKKLVEIEDISGEVMEALLKYVYECTVQGIEGIAADLLVAADKYDIPLLVAECTQSIIRHLKVSNAAYFFHFANFHQINELKEEVGKFISDNKAAVRQSDGYKEFIKPNNDLMEQFIDLII